MVFTVIGFVLFGNRVIVGGVSVSLTTDIWKITCYDDAAFSGIASIIRPVTDLYS